MKKILNFNFVSVVILAAVLVLVALFVGVGLSDVTNGVEKAGREVGSYIEGDEVDDVEGWGFIFGGAAVGLAAIAVGVVWIAFVFVPAALAVFMIIPAIIARLIYRADKGRILAYRILMFFSYLWMAVLAFLLGIMIVEGELSVFTVIVLGLFLYIVVTAFFGIRNTYSARIRGELKDAVPANTEEY